MRKSVFAVRSLVLLVAVLCGLSTAAQETLQPHTIAVFGSSVANGSGDHEERGGYAGRLGELLAPRGWGVVNVSRGGDNTIKIAPRFEADLLPQKAQYVVIGLSLANEGIAKQEGTEYRDGIYNQWRTGMLALIERCRDAGMTVAVGNCYAKDVFTTSPDLYAYTRRMNVEISRWDVPSINFLGTIDDGTGAWVEGFYADGGHPNGAGHNEMFFAIVPSLFEALAAGKPLPAKANESRFAQASGGNSAKAPLLFAPEDPMHSFAVSFWVRPKSNGVLAAITGREVSTRTEEGEKGGRAYKATVLEPGEGSFSAEVAMRDGAFAYTGPGGTLSVGLTEPEEWRHVVVSHWCARGATQLYVDGVLAGDVAERLFPEAFYLGGSAMPGTIASADFKEWAVYRSSLNADSVQFLHEGRLYQSSLEVYAPLADTSFAPGAAVENRAQSMSEARVVTDSLTSEFEQGASGG